MLNYERIVKVIEEELGDGGAEAITDAIGLYLLHGEENFGCREDGLLIWPLFYLLDMQGHNFLLKEYDPSKQPLSGLQ